MHTRVLRNEHVFGNETDFLRAMRVGHLGRSVL